MNSKPFEAETPAPMSIADPIAEGIARLRQQHRDNVAAHRAAFDEEAGRAWVAAEAKRKAEFIKDYHDRNFFPLKYPYARLDRAGQFRVSLPYDSRIELLAEQKLYDQCLYCVLARNTNGNPATVDKVKAWFKLAVPDFTVDGDFMIISKRGSHERSYVASAATSTNDLVHARGLSDSFAELLNYTSMVEVQFGMVRWVVQDFDPADY
jgi:hypothetical protein